MNENVIEFKEVSKIYKLYKNDKRRLLGIFFKKIPYKEKKAVNNVSFNIKRGEAVAIFGKNGAGKSTILKMIKENFSSSYYSTTNEGHQGLGMEFYCKATNPIRNYASLTLSLIHI